MSADDVRTAAAAAQDRLEGADAAVAEHRRLRDRVAQARARLVLAHEAVADAETRLASEAADVRALEGYSPTRIWAGLRGEREVELQREEAERQQAEYFVAVARAEVQRVQAEIDASALSLQRLGDVDAAREAALTAKEVLIRSDGGAAGVVLAQISQRAGRLRAEGTELAEAEAAAADADQELGEALQLLGKADDWATWDVFGGGGGITDAMKYHRMDEATRRLERCRQLLRRLSEELTDTAIPALELPSVSMSQQMFDTLLDNVFSDWSVRNRIRDALDGARAAHDQVRDARRQLGQRRAAVVDELAALARQREDLLT